MNQNISEIQAGDTAAEKRSALSCDSKVCQKPLGDIEDTVIKVITIEEGAVNSVALCCCQQSKNFPLCDGTHNEFNRQTNSNIQPALISKKDFMEVEKAVQKFGLSASNDNQKTPTSDITPPVARKSDIRQSCDTLPNSRKTPTLSSSTDRCRTILTQNPNSLLKSPKSWHDFKKINKRQINAIWTAEEVAKHNTADDCWMIINVSCQVLLNFSNNLFFLL